MPTDVQVVADAYDLAKAVLPAVARFPRSQRFTLGDRIETRGAAPRERLRMHAARHEPARTRL